MATSIGSLVADLTLESAAFTRDLTKAARALDSNAAQMRRSLQGVENATRGLERQAQTLRNTLSGVGAMLAGLGVGLVLREIVRTTAEFQRLNASLRTVTGSSAAATAAFNDIKRFAATTPFDLQQVTGAFIKLKALGLDPSMEALTSYGNTASAMGKQLNDFIEAVADAAGFQFERLREFGITASQQGDQVAFTFQGVTTTIRKNAADIETYLRGIGDVQFGGAMAEQVNTLGGALSNLGDNVTTLLAEIGEGGFGEAVADLSRKIADLAAGSSNLAREIGGALGVAVRTFTDIAMFAARNLREIGAAIAAIIAYKVTVVFIGMGVALADLVTKLVAARAAFVTLGAVIAANPIGLIATAIGVAVAALIIFRDKTFEVGGATIQVGRVVSAVWTTIAEGANVVTTAIGYVGASLAAIAEGDFDLLNNVRRAASEEVIGSINAIGEAWSHLGPELAASDDEVADLASAMADLAEDVADAAGEADKASEKFGDLIAKLVVERDHARALAKAHHEGAEAVDFMTTAIAVHNAELQSGVTFTDEQRRALADLINETRDYNREIDATIEAQKAAEQAAADAAKAREKALEDQREALAREAEETERLLRQPFENFLQGVQSATSDMFQSVFSGGVKSFGDLFATVKQLGIRWAAEMAALMVFNPRVVGGLGSIGGVSGLTGGGGFLSSLGSLPGLGGIVSSVNGFGASLGFAATPGGFAAPGAFAAGAAGPPAVMGGFFGSGATLAGTLGAAGIGAFGGTLLAQLTGGNQVGGGIGGALGAGIGFAVGGPIGGVIGGTLGGLGGSLFGPGKSVGANATAVLGVDNGRFVVTSAGADNGGNADAARREAAKAAAFLNELADALDLSAVTNISRNARTLAMGSATRGQRSAEAMVSAILQSGGLAGGTPELEAVLRGSSAANVQDNIALLSQIPGLLSPATSAFEKAMKAINDNFDRITDKAEEFGLATDLVAQAREREIAALEAQVRAPFVADAANIVNFLNAQRLSATSSLNPMERVDEARRQFADLVARANAGEAGLSGALTQSANALLSIGRETFASSRAFADIEAYVQGSLFDVAGQFSSEGFLDRQVEATRQQTEVAHSDAEAIQDELALIRRELVLLGQKLAS